MQTGVLGMPCASSKPSILNVVNRLARHIHLHECSGHIWAMAKAIAHAGSRSYHVKSKMTVFIYEDTKTKVTCQIQITVLVRLKD